MYTYEDIFGETGINDLYRIMNSNKDYAAVLLYGYSHTSVVLTNNPQQFENMDSDKLLILLCVSYELQETTREMLIKKASDISSAWTKQCYYYDSFSEWLNDGYKITEYKYKQLLALEAI